MLGAYAPSNGGSNVATHYDPRILGADRWQAHPDPEAMAHRESDLIRGLDPEARPAIRCGICGYSAHNRVYMADHYIIVHGVRNIGFADLIK